MDYVRMVLRGVKMNHLWSPWRMNYIMNPDRNVDCVFCDALLVEDGPGNLIVFRGPQTFLILNRYPYTSGHVMIVPNVHLSSLDEFSPATRGEMIELASQVMPVLRVLYHPDGFNVGINQGVAAGAGISEHLHLHVVPRWEGDTNFMSVVAQARVLPESMADSYERIRNEWNKRFWLE